MSEDVMLHGVLNMPPECWSNRPLDVAQRHSRYVEASYRIQQLERELAEVTKQRDAAIEGLEKIASLDFVITLPDRMDAVRNIARETLNKLKP